ncbi:hypothetical protein GTCCBUS3UF5_33110 [Geobacillus thermoleovorans CCB_US3_UF5]|uniref:Uncharacterized protein n=1 Tax=Geobacillus thermoleovorans CCB_US3_UF5 TaxID=1111068 RepID=A0ABN4A259_GEOTH|nr:hypothetical protein GTCCBUS3UF5_33110 [Geobacillus thermoleovorans CCB_US3_UF5]GAJ57626.1 hypothetical protein B23_0816 [Geobacillus thermoleovorans B23]
MYNEKTGDIPIVPRRCRHYTCEAQKMFRRESCAFFFVYENAWIG